ncbi:MULTISPECIES: hypothetical protein [Microcoleaceae]|uniref:hypothetical protein n=1 Tax=Microcoleaceae TaxID=1892252 RepID=UPI00187F4216|nr:hypothetical protein [Tychonema sp. LEGE 06208]MBE9164088.1 hypothetical protein [Tychonema sp. LEGE 06208]
MGSSVAEGLGIGPRRALGEREAEGLGGAKRRDWAERSGGIGTGNIMYVGTCI